MTNLNFIIPITVFLTISVTFNFYFLFKKVKKKDLPQSLELKEFLADLLSGPSIIAVTRLERDDLMLRSPKQK